MSNNFIKKINSYIIEVIIGNEKVMYQYISNKFPDK